MSKLVEAQTKFTLMVAKLIEFAYKHGFELTFGDAWAQIGHKKDSNHYIRLAVDFNLFEDGEYLPNDNAHLPLGIYWESLGGSWGGRFGDGNHYSLEFEGRR